MLLLLKIFLDTLRLRQSGSHFADDTFINAFSWMKIFEFRFRDLSQHRQRIKSLVSEMSKAIVLENHASKDMLIIVFAIGFKKNPETTSKFLFLLKSLQNNMTSINSLLCLTDNTKKFPHSDKALDFHEACYLIKCSSCYVRFNHCQAYIIETFKGYFAMPCDTPDGTYIMPQA